MKRRDEETARRCASLLIRWRRETPKLTYKKMADLMEVSPQQFQKYKNAANTPPLSKMRRLAIAIHRSPHELSYLVQDSAQRNTVAEMMPIYGMRMIPVINRVRASFDDLWSADDLGFPPGFAERYIQDMGIEDRAAFGLAVHGSSMKGAGINPGDVVIISPNSEVKPNDIALVLILSTQEATIKRVRFLKGGAVLELIADSEQEDRRQIDTTKEHVKVLRVSYHARRL